MKRFFSLLKFVWKLAVCVSLSVIAVPDANARQPQRGYRGFLDWSNSLHRYSDNYGYGLSETIWYTGFSTSHGYQINNRWFAGLGLDFEQSTRYDINIVSLFAQGRLDLQFGKATPYADLRAGWNIVDGGGLYFSPTAGYRFNWGRKVALNIGLGLTLRGYKVDQYYIEFTDGWLTMNYLGTTHKVEACFSFRAGIEF